MNGDSGAHPVGTSSDERREPRVRYSIRVRVEWDGHTQEVTARDVSRRGVFVRTDTPPPVGQVVQVHLFLGNPGEEVSAAARVAHAVDPSMVASEGPPGFGVHLLGLDDARRQLWETFVVRVAQSPQRGGLAGADGARPPVTSRMPRALLDDLCARMDKLGRAG